MISPFDTTDITLFVRTSGEDIVRWNRQRIVEALIRETGVDVDTAETISRDVEKQIVASGISLLTTPLIRELVDAKLIERGLEHDRRGSWRGGLTGEHLAAGRHEHDAYQERRSKCLSGDTKPSIHSATRRSGSTGRLA